MYLKWDLKEKNKIFLNIPVTRKAEVREKGEFTIKHFLDSFPT